MIPNDLKVIDVIMMPRFKEHIEACIKQIRQKRLATRAVAFKRGPLERLQEKGMFGPNALANLYAKVLDSSLDNKEYPSAVRAFIKLIGDEAFRRTVNELKEVVKNESE